MQLTIYKPGQGYWTRLFSGIGFGVLVLSGAYWLQQQLQGLTSSLYLQTGILLAFVAVLGLLGYWALGANPRVVEFMIATEAEMKKVNWPTRREIVGSTWVVVCGTFIFATLLFVIDILFAYGFTLIRILHLS